MKAFWKGYNDYRLKQDFVRYNQMKENLALLATKPEEYAMLTFYAAERASGIIKYLSVTPVADWLFKKAENYEPSNGFKYTLIHSIISGPAILIMLSEGFFFVARSILKGVAFGLAAALYEPVFLLGKHVLKPMLEFQIKMMDKKIKKNPHYQANILTEDTLLEEPQVAPESQQEPARGPSTDFFDNFINREIGRGNTGRNTSL